MATQLNMMTQGDREVLEGQILSMREDLSDMKGSMSKVAQALTTLAVLEERHQAVAAATNKILTRIEKMEERQIIMDKREFALIEVTRRVDTAESRVELAESRVKILEDLKNVQDGQIKGATNTVKIIWAILAGSGLSAVIFGLILL